MYSEGSYQRTANTLQQNNRVYGTPIYLRFLLENFSGSLKFCPGLAENPRSNGAEMISFQAPLIEENREPAIKN